MEDGGVIQFKRRSAYLLLGISVPVIFAIIIGMAIQAFTFQANLNSYLLSIRLDIIFTFGVAVIAFARYFARKNSVVMFIAVAFMSNTVLNVIQVLFISGYGSSLVSQDHALIIYWAWFIAHTLWAVLIGMSVLVWYLRKKYGRSADVRPSVVYIFVILLTIAGALIFLYLPLPQPYVNDFVLSRPWELLPSVIMVAALIGYIKKGEWKDSPFDYWLIISLVFTSIAHLVFMAHSQALYDEFFYAAVILNDIGIIAAAQGMLRSISQLFLEFEKNEAELLERFQDIRREKALDEAMIESIGDALVMTDSDTRIMRVNAAFTQLTGWTDTQAVGQPVTKVMPLLDKTGKEVPYEQRSQAKALFAGQKVVLDMDFSIQRKNGTTFPIASTVNPIILDGEIIGAIEIFRDVTREKMIDDQKSTFVSVASHQLRTPLTTLNWYTEMLLSGDAGKVNPEQKEYLDEIYQGSKRLVVLVNDLLNVSRIETGRLKIDPQPTNVVALIESTIEEVQPLLQGRDIAINFTNNGAPKQFTEVPVDDVLLRQVVHNLLTNAIRYSPQNKKCTVSLSLATKNYSTAFQRAASPVPPGEYMLITIADQGIGIPKKEQEHIFQKFFRAENALHAAADGSGLGLYFIKMILDSAGGAVWFESKEGKGTTFSVAVPLKGMTKREGEKSLSVAETPTVPKTTEETPAKKKETKKIAPKKKLGVRKRTVSTKREAAKGK